MHEQAIKLCLLRRSSCIINMTPWITHWSTYSHWYSNEPSAMVTDLLLTWLCPKLGPHLILISSMTTHPTHFWLLVFLPVPVSKQSGKSVTPTSLLKTKWCVFKRPIYFECLEFALEALKDVTFSFLTLCIVPKRWCTMRRGVRLTISVSDTGPKLVT